MRCGAEGGNREVGREKGDGGRWGRWNRGSEGGTELGEAYPMGFRGSARAFGAEVKIDGGVCEVALTITPLKMERSLLRAGKSGELVFTVEVVSEIHLFLK